MDRTERFYKIDQLLHEYGQVSIQTFLDELGISLATFKRDLEYLRDRLNAPIIWDRKKRAYIYDQQTAAGPRYALPGLWFSASEIHALLTVQSILSNLQPGLLEQHIAPLQTRITMLLDSGDHSSDEVGQRICILHNAARQVEPKHFQVISSALLSRKRLNLCHYSRSNDKKTEREISPQRLSYYRENWYVDAWCHLRKALRSFSVDTIDSVNVLDKMAKNIDLATLAQEMDAGYGIFSGKAKYTAVLRFSPERSRWVASENWHPQQKTYFDEQGYYILEFPYSDHRELMMDILKYGVDVEVLSPKSLRQHIADQHKAALAQY